MCEGLHSSRSGFAPVFIVLLFAVVFIIVFILFKSLNQQPIQLKTNIVPTPIVSNTPKEIDINLSGFKKLTANPTCAEIKNQLFVIDNKFVFLDREGNCTDNRYTFTLYGSSEKEGLCGNGDSIAGPRKSCTDKSYSDFFETIIKNRDKNDLGLGSSHLVQKVD